MPVADFGIEDALVGLLLIAGAVALLTLLFLRGLRSVPRASRPLLWTIAMLVLFLEFFILLFAYVYLSLEVTMPGSVPGIVTHLDAVYFTVTMLATVGFGDITPATQVVRSIATFQMLVNLVLLAVAYARMPAADLGIQDALVGLLLIAGAVVMLTLLFLRGLRTVPRASRPLLWTIAMLVVFLEFFILLFSYVYLSLEVAIPGSVPGIVTHLDAVYFTVTMLATVGFGDITPATQVARSIATFQMLVNLLLLGAVVRVGVSVGKRAAERRVATDGLPVGSARMREAVQRWETGQDVGTAGREGTS
jgi:hypothetical protein